ncbi:hypothetical protein [Rhodanobacter sp. C05]|uniref:hypothetical protein n=1 Tax=Rhodanobacter sp. C05 TaxID=1945855 RepID=UPI00117A08AB|nr:hypothetical protein [Rhodanobacter sp. C05]
MRYELAVAQEFARGFSLHLPSIPEQQLAACLSLLTPHQRMRLLPIWQHEMGASLGWQLHLRNHEILEAACYPSDTALRTRRIKQAG